MIIVDDKGNELLDIIDVLEDNAEKKMKPFENALRENVKKSWDSKMWTLSI